MGRERQAAFYAYISITLAENSIVFELLVIGLVVGLGAILILVLKPSKSRDHEHPYYDSHEGYAYPSN